MVSTVPTSARSQVVKKVPTGIRGFDEMSNGGLPVNRVTLLCGGPGSGKTLFGMEFLLRGARDYGEPGVLVSFDQSAPELLEDTAGTLSDYQQLIDRKLLATEVVRIGNVDVEESGGYDLDGLLARIERSIAAIGARRVVLDAVDGLFDLLPSPRALRTELGRVLRALKSHDTAIVMTCERGAGVLSRHGLEEYLADCVITLDQHVHEQVTTRRLRIVKYRGSQHAKDEVPFTINEGGIHLAPVAAVLDHKVSDERVSTGVPRLDAMLGGSGVFRGSTVLIAGDSGTGKTSLAVHAVAAACGRGERCIYFAFEESSHQIVRNMRSIGIDLQPHVDRGLLRFEVTRPTAHGLERHLGNMRRATEAWRPQVVVIDPISGFDVVGTAREVHAMLTRLIDFLKSHTITTVMTNLSHTERGAAEVTGLGLSSVVDAWLHVAFVEGSGERNRALYVLKSRGMAHSNQVREFVMTSHGIDLVDVYVGSNGVLTGAARRLQEAKEQDESLAAEHAAARREREASARERVLEARIAALRAELDAAHAEAREAKLHEDQRRARLERERGAMARIRQADAEAERPERG